MSYRVGIIGCGRMGGTIDDEITESHPDFILPYGHAGGYAAVPETEVVAAADTDGDRLQSWCDRFGVARRYADYREMIREEALDIVSAATHAVSRAAPIVFAAEAGVRGIYAEKALCASAAELDAIVGACTRRGTRLVYGAMRRYWAGFETARSLIDSGVLGAPRAAVLGAAGGAAFHTHSHFVDAAMYLLGDPVPVGVSARLQDRDGRPLQIERDDAGLTVALDPGIEFASIEFDSGARLECTHLPYSEIELVCEEGTLRSWGDSSGYAARRQVERYEWEDVPFPTWQARSGTVEIIRDLLQAMETGCPGRGSLETTRRGMEILFGMVASHAAGGARVELPLADRGVRVDSR